MAGRRPSVAGAWRQLPRGGDPKPLLVTPFSENSPTISPDGRWMAYSSNESGTREAYVQTFPALGSKTAVSSGGGWAPVWSPGSGEIIYVESTGLMAAQVTTTPTLSLGPPRSLIQGQFESLSPNIFDPHHAVAPDGQRFVMLVGDDDERAAGVAFQVALNWVDELKRRVPTR